MATDQIRQFWTLCLKDDGNAYELFASLNYEHPDRLVQRFLEARSGNVTAAVAMLNEALRWRREHDVQGIMKRGEEHAKDLQLESGKVVIHGLAKEGQLVAYIHVQRHKLFEQSIANMQTYVVHQIETACRMLENGQKVVMVFGFTPSNWDAACVLFIWSHWGQRHPGIIDKVIGYKCVSSERRLDARSAPWHFKPIWQCLKPMLDKSVLARTIFVNDLRPYIAPEHLLAQCGGTNSSNFRYKAPIAGENDAQLDTDTTQKLLSQQRRLVTDYIAVTREWCRLPSDDLQLRRQALVERLILLQPQLDPYVRGRTIYDRNGTIRADGTVRFGYSNAKEDVVGRAHSADSITASIDAIEISLSADAGADSLYDPLARLVI